MSLRARFNLSDHRDKQKLLESVRSLAGEHRVEITRWRPRRSDRQNRFYWPCFVQQFSDWLSAEWERGVHEDEAHSILKDRFLRVPVTTADGETVFDVAGDPVMRTRSTTELTTTEFNLYLDCCAEFLREWCKITVPDPCTYHERVEVTA